MSDTTFSLMTEGKVSEMLRSKVPTLDRCQALCDFVLFDLNHTGDEIGRWLEDAHGSVGCKPSYIGSHVVDGAGNAGKSVEVLKWQTSDSRKAQIVTHKCDAHQTNMAGKCASETSSHAVNLNPDCGTALTLLPTSLIVCVIQARGWVLLRMYKKNRNEPKQQYWIVQSRQDGDLTMKNVSNQTLIRRTSKLPLGTWCHLLVLTRTCSKPTKIIFTKSYPLTMIGVCTNSMSLG